MFMNIEANGSMYTININHIARVYEDNCAICDIIMSDGTNLRTNKSRADVLNMIDEVRRLAVGVLVPAAAEAASESRESSSDDFEETRCAIIGAAVAAQKELPGESLHYSETITYITSTGMSKTRTVTIEYDRRPD